MRSCKRRIKHGSYHVHITLSSIVFPKGESSSPSLLTEKNPKKNTRHIPSSLSPIPTSSFQVYSSPSSSSPSSSLSPSSGLQTAQPKYNELQNALTPISTPSSSPTQCPSSHLHSHPPSFSLLLTSLFSPGDHPSSSKEISLIRNPSMRFRLWLA